MCDREEVTPRKGKDRRKNFRRDEDIGKEKEHHERFARASLTQVSLISADYENGHDRSGIRQVLNRLLAMMQTEDGHKAILVFKKETENKDCRLLYHTMHDPFWKDAFEDRLKKESGYCYMKGDYLFLKTNHFKDRAVNFVDDIYFGFVHLDFKFEHGLACNEIKKLKLLTKHALEKRFFLPRLLDDYSKKDSLLHGIFSPKKLNKQFEERGESDKWEKGRYLIDAPDIKEIKFPEDKISLWDDKYRNGDDILSQDFYDDHRKKIVGLFDREYENIRDSRILWDGSDNLPNILFSIRVFSRTTERYITPNAQGAYLYDVKTIIPPAQRKDIENALKKIKKENIGKKIFRGEHNFFWAEIDEINRLEKLILSEKNKKIKEEHVDNQNEIFDQIFSTLEQGYEDGSRTLSDMVYSGGYVRVAINPIPENGAYRIGKDAWESIINNRIKSIFAIDYRRVVYLHYIMALIVPSEKRTQMLLIPGFVSGSPWCCMVYVANPKNNKHKRWMDGYHFYHNIHRQVIKSLRRNLKKLYLSELKELFLCLTKGFMYFIDEGEKESLAPSKFIDNFNSRAKFLCRVYPIDYVSLSMSDNEVIEDCQRAHHQIFNFSFNVLVNNNPYFNTSKNKKSYLLSFDEIKNSFNSIYGELISEIRDS